MRPAAWFLSSVLCASGCGGALEPPDGGPVEADAATGPDGGADVESMIGVCVYETCGGLSLCGAGKTCPVGDGCNSCSCAAVGGGRTASTCTTTPCGCP